MARSLHTGSLVPQKLNGGLPLRLGGKDEGRRGQFLGEPPKARRRSHQLQQEQRILDVYIHIICY